MKEIVENLTSTDQDPIEILASREIPAPVNLLTFWPISPPNLINMMHGFKPSKSPDVFGMSTFMLHIVIDVIAVINECLVVGTFPDFLKTSRIIPVYRKGDHLRARSY